jgi:hypothetical protein
MQTIGNRYFPMNHYILQLDCSINHNKVKMYYLSQ